MRRLLLATALVATPAAAQTATDAQIAAAKARIAAIEADIERHAGPLATRTEAIRAEIRYRPLIAWAAAFSAKPEADRTLSFQQTGVGGRLVEQVSVCKLIGGRPGYWAAIPNGTATSASVTIGSLSIVPDSSGVLVHVPLALSAGSQLEGHFQLQCIPWGPTLTATFSGSATPAAAFRLNFGTVDGGVLDWSLDLVSPSSIAIASRVEFGKFGFDLTLPMNNLTRQLTQGKLDLPYSSSGALALPGGKSLPYSLAVRNPQVIAGSDAITLSANVDITIGDGRPLAAQVGPQR
jgi:hypothetical protein